MQFEGEVQLCKNAWHNFGDGKKYADPAATSPRQPVSAEEFYNTVWAPRVIHNVTDAFEFAEAYRSASLPVTPEFCSECPGTKTMHDDNCPTLKPGWLGRQSAIVSHNMNKLAEIFPEAASLPVQQAQPPIDSNVFGIRICDDCIDLKGEMCHTPYCVFCRRTMREVGEYLDLLLIRPIVDGERFPATFAESLKATLAAAPSTPPASSPTGEITKFDGDMFWDWDDPEQNIDDLDGYLYENRSAGDIVRIQQAEHLPDIWGFWTAAKPGAHTDDVDCHYFRSEAEAKLAASSHNTTEGK